jgi:RNA polymerase sigma-70 factor (ECF subfamily)
MQVQTSVTLGTAQLSAICAIKDPDERLVNEAIRGSSGAFGILFERHERQVFRVAYRVLRNREDAEDAAQQAFQRALVHLKTFQGHSRFSTWLMRIAINEALMLLRKRRPGFVSIDGAVEDGGIALDVEDNAATPEERCEEQELFGFLSEAIGTLRPVLRSVVELHDIGELSMEKTADALGLSGSTAKARLFRARSALRLKLTARLGGGMRRWAGPARGGPRHWLACGIAPRSFTDRV